MTTARERRKVPREQNSAYRPLRPDHYSGELASPLAPRRNDGGARRRQDGVEVALHVGDEAGALALPGVGRILVVPGLEQLAVLVRDDASARVGAVHVEVDAR